MHFVFCQISTNLINAKLPDDIATEYYRKQWEKPGYYKSEHFWEIPLWIAEICGSLKHADPKYTTELCIIAEHNQTLPDGDYYLFSVLDVNKAIIKDIIRDNPKKEFVLGGYVNLQDMPKQCPCGCCNHVAIFYSVKEFIESWQQEYTYNLDYSLFAGMQTMPRLTMSTGCKHRCKFCTVLDELTEVSAGNIAKQINSFRVLDFRYVYLNDKTFGQCNNYRCLDVVRTAIKMYNPSFAGFIVQTTADKCSNPAFVAELKAMGVLIVELGVETYNDGILKAYHKPQNTDIVDRAINNLYDIYLAIIPNIIIGLDGENEFTYRSTISYLHNQRDKFYALNIYNLVRYDTADDDKNERSFTGNDIDKQFYNDVFALGLEILRQ